MSDPILPPRVKLCPCHLCKVSYEIVDFVEMIVDDAKVVELDRLNDIDPETKSDIRAVRIDALINACAEMLFREGGHPDMMFNQFSQAWNNRAQRALSGEDRPESEKLLDDYRS